MDFEQDLKFRQETWNSFTKLTTIGGIGVVILLILMAIFIL